MALNRGRNKRTMPLFRDRLLIILQMLVMPLYRRATFVFSSAVALRDCVLMRFIKLIASLFVIGFLVVGHVLLQVYGEILLVTAWTLLVLRRLGFGLAVILHLLFRTPGILLPVLVAFERASPQPVDV